MLNSCPYPITKTPFLSRKNIILDTEYLMHYTLHIIPARNAPLAIRADLILT